MRLRNHGLLKIEQMNLDRRMVQDQERPTVGTLETSYHSPVVQKVLYANVIPLNTRILVDQRCSSRNMTCISRWLPESEIDISKKLSCAVESAVQHLASVMKEKGRKRHERKKSQASRKEKVQAS
eukprot:Em0001g1012a